jgi:hypothetical protein
VCVNDIIVCVCVAAYRYNNSFVLEEGGGPGNVLEPGANGGAQRPALLLDPESGRPTHLYVAASCGASPSVSLSLCLFLVQYYIMASLLLSVSLAIARRLHVTQA